MKKLIFALGLVTALGVQAETISPDKALARAMKDVPRRSMSIMGGTNGGSPQLVMTREFAGSPAVYVFGNADNSGFVVTSSKDSGVALLGYGDGKITDEIGNLPPQFVAWLDLLARQTDWNDRHSSDDARGVGRIVRPDREPIAPLLTTKWNQSFPYNKKCPKYSGEQSVTGCVATAMSQVMKYHNWPETGVGKHTYMSNGKELKINFETTTFDWDNMLDEYPATKEGDEVIYAGTEEQQDAVAVLMKAAGYSVNMNYSPNSSGAVSMRIAPALGEYFRYDKSLRYLNRDYYSLREWEDLIYNSLVNDGPVIYDGQSTIGGHSFVCDGYSSDGYFHFNWGWGGMSDGYFVLDALDPLHQGIGGADGGFDFMQDAIIGIRPDRTGESVWNSSMVSSEPLTLTYDEDENGIYTETMFYNNGPGVMTNPSVGFIFKPVGGGDSRYFGEATGDDLNLMYGYRGFGLDMPEIEDGKYLVTVGYKSNAEDEDFHAVLYPIYGTSEYEITVSDGVVSEMAAVEPGRPTVVNMTFPDRIVSGEPIELKFTIKNPNDTPYLCYVSPQLIVAWDDMDSFCNAGGRMQVVDIDADSSEEVSVMIDFNYAKLTYPDDAEAFVCLYEKYGNTGLRRISDLYPVMIDGLAAGVSAPVMTEGEEVPALRYDAQGRCLGAGNRDSADKTGHGLLIVRKGNRTSKILK